MCKVQNVNPNWTSALQRVHSTQCRKNWLSIDTYWLALGPILLVAYFKRAPRLLVSLQLFAQDLYNRVDDWIRSRLIWSIGACDTGVWLSRFIFMIFIYYLYYQEDNSITSMQVYSMLIWSIGAGDAGESGSQDCCSSISSPLQNIIKLLRNLFAISYFSFRIRNWEFRSSARRKG